METLKHDAGTTIAQVTREKLETQNPQAICKCSRMTQSLSLRFVAPLPQNALSEIDHQQNVWNGENVFM